MGGGGLLDKNKRMIDECKAFRVDHQPCGLFYVCVCHMQTDRFSAHFNLEKRAKHPTMPLQTDNKMLKSINKRHMSSLR